MVIRIKALRRDMMGGIEVLIQVCIRTHDA
jgi:hypothetical protein